MEATTFCLLVLAGIGGGLCGYLTGLASLVTYPALVAAGLAPVTANVSNTLGVLCIGIGSTISASDQLRGLGRRRILRDCAVALAGGAIGGGLLLASGDAGFEQVVPWLVLLASLVLLAQPSITRLSGDVDSTPLYLGGLFLVCVYGGYFGAGAGVCFLALGLLVTRLGFARSMMMKSMLLGVSNLAASAVFVVGAPVDWWAALAMGIGCFTGGRLGPAVQRRIPQDALRVVISLAGIGLAAWLWRSAS